MPAIFLRPFQGREIIARNERILACIFCELRLESPRSRFQQALQHFKTALFLSSQAGIHQGGLAPVITGKAKFFFLSRATDLNGQPQSRATSPKQSSGRL
jgi:hypothetical protein